VPDDPGDDREMEKCCGRSQATAPPETPSAKHGVFLLNRGSNKLHLILDKKLAAFNTNYLAQGFGLRFGERESEAQAERRRERSRSGTTVAEPQAESPPTIRH
jgi:hypothetical protein